jgi:CheY-like chemotaxis protein
MILATQDPIKCFYSDIDYKNSGLYDMPSKSMLAKHRVLIIDNDTVCNTIHCLFLTKMGFKKIDIARCGADAISQATQVNYSLILLEISLPDINGYKVCKSIRKLNKHKTTPLIAVTTFIDKSIKDSCKAYDICEVITKPLSYPTYKKALLKNLSLKNK